MRKLLVVSHRNGKHLMIDIGQSKPDFAAEFTSDDTFKTDLVFDYAKWRDYDNHKRFVREEERKADSENSEDGYEMHSEACLSIVSTATDERDIS